MSTEILDMKNNGDYEKLNIAKDVIRNGELVLFPTETVYGIGADALNDEAVRKIYLAKGRASDNPLILHISDMSMLNMIAENISPLEYKLMDAFWPGPFTIVLNKKKNIANVATCNGDTVGVRMPSNRIAHELIKRANTPIAAPSANISGKPSGTRLSDIIDELKDKVSYIIDGGECDIGLESTVVRVMNDEVHILRPGKITKEDIERITNDVEIDKHILSQLDPKEKVLSPGMKYRHYAPATKCMLIYGNDEQLVLSKFREVIRNLKESENIDKKDILILGTNELIAGLKELQTINLGSKNDLENISHNIFSALRKVDSYNAKIALIEGVEPTGLGLAIMNRLIRACEFNTIFLKN